MAGHFENGVWIEDPPGYEKPDIYIDPNKAAIDALVKRNLDLIDGLEDDVKNKMLTILSDGLMKGQGIDEIIRNMESAGVALGYAAERIARTEIMYALNQGALNRYKNDGIEYVQWLAGPDDRCCPVCLGYHLQVFPINDAPDIPAHPSCLLPDTRCITAGDIVSGLRAWYDGPVFEICASAGSHITVTPNHMFLTPHGICAAQFLRKGDDIINCSGFERIITDNPDDYQTPSTIEDIFNSFFKSSSGSPGSMPVTPEDLHSDARFTNGKIDIIFPDRFLGIDCEAIFKKHFSGGNFDPTCKSEVPFFSTSPLYEFLFRAAFASDRGMSGNRKTSSFFSGRSAHPDIHRFGSVSWSDPNCFKSSNNERAAAVECFCDVLNRFAGFIHLDNIVSINVKSYSGYVYDLQTVSTLYIGNNNLISNCRCTLGPHFAEYNGRADREREQFEEDVESGKAPYNSNKWSDEDIRKWKEAGSKYEDAPDEPILIQKEKKKRRGEKIP